MREIKFRAWANGMKRMFQNVTVYPDQSVKSAEIYGAYSISLPDYSNMNDIEKAVKDDWVIMQFTGLTDKNGVEIWEGDVIKAGPYYTPVKNATVLEEYTIGQVIWNDNGFDYEYFWLTQRTATGILGSFNKEHCKEYEVLGNLYENPELLERNK